MSEAEDPQRKVTFRLLILSRSLRSVGVIYVVLSLPLYLLNFTNIVTIGILFSISGISTLLISLFSGLMGDRIGYKKVLMLVEIPSIISMVVLALSSNTLLIFIAVAVGGTAGTPGAMRGAFSPGVTAYIATLWKEREERVDKLSLFTAVGSFSAIAGSLLLIAKGYLFNGFSPVYSYRILYGFSAIMILVSLLMLSMMLTDHPVKRQVRVMRKSSWTYTLKVSAGNLMNGMGLGLAIALLPAWLHLRFDTSSTTIGELFTASYFFTGIASLLASSRSNVGRERHVLIGGITRSVQGILLIVIAFLPSILFVAIIYSMRSMVAGFGAPIRTAVNVGGISEGDYGSASSIQGVSMRAGQSTSAISGYLMSYDTLLPLVGGGLIQGLGGLVYYLILKSRKSVDG